MFIRKTVIFALLTATLPVMAGNFIPADSGKLDYSDYAILDFVPDSTGTYGKVARMHRPLSSPRKGYNWDNPGARLRLKTDSKAVTIHLIYNDKHISTSARNPIGIYYIDGQSKPDWTFRTKARKKVRKVEKLDLKMPAGNGRMHTYEIIMPYGDSIDIAGVTVDDGAKLVKPEPRPAYRCGIYGDSVTHGFTAKAIGGTYAYKLAKLKNWQLVNLGIGGRSSGSSAGDGLILGKLELDRLVILMGVNDWQGGRNIASYKKNMKKFIADFRKLQPTIPMTFITPLWVPSFWKPKRAKYDLEDYRKALSEVVKQANDPNIQLIEGPGLIDHQKELFDRVAVHPNDKGFDMMAKRLAAKIK